MRLRPLWEERCLPSTSVVDQLLSSVRLYDPMGYSMPGLPVLHHLLELLKFMSVESLMPSSHLILCRPLLLLPSVFPSIRVFSSDALFS